MAFHSGIGTYIRHLVPRIAEARPEWHFTVLLHAAERTDGAGWLRALPNVRIVHCQAPIYSLREQLAVVRAVPARTSVLWVPHFNVPLLYRGRMLVTVHDLFHLALPELAGGAHRRAYARVMFEHIRRRAAVVLCVSDFTAGEFVRRVGAPRGRLRTTHLGIDDGWRAAQPGDLPRTRPYVVFVGNVKPHKNVRGLLEAFARVRHEVPHDLVIVGQREGMRTADPEVEERAAALGERVVFTGRVPEEELRRLVAGATALAFPSRYEGFGLPPLEAMAAGCPTVVARAGSLPEVCGDATLYCDPGDTGSIAHALRRILTDASLRAELARRGRAHAASFRWEGCAASSAEALEEALRQ